MFESKRLLVEKMMELADKVEREGAWRASAYYVVIVPELTNHD